MAYSVDYIANLIDQNRTSNPALAAALFGSAGAMGGALDTALRSKWGVDAAKQWINQSDLNYKGGFDFKTGKWGVQGVNGLETGTLAGWDPSQWDPTAASSGYFGDLTSGKTSLSYDPTKAAGAFAGQTGIGVGADGKTPMPDGVGSQAWMTGTTGATTGGFAKPAAVGGATATGYAPTSATGASAPGATPGATAGATAGPSAPVGSPFDYFNDAGYQFAKQQGMDGIQNSAAARGSLQSGATLKALADYNSGLANQYYGDAYDRWNQQGRNARGDYENDRDYSRGIYQNDRDYNRSVLTGDRAWDRGIYQNDRDFDYAAALSDRDYNEGVRRYDQGFNYTAALNDQNQNQTNLRTLAGLGSSNSNSMAALNQWLAQMYGSNTMTGAGAGSQGTMGQANSINSFISQLLNAISGNRILSQYGIGG